MKFLKLCVLPVGIAFNFAPATELEPGEKMAILSGQSFETYGWGTSGYIRLVTKEVEKTGVRGPVSVCIQNKKTEQMLAVLDADLIAKKPAYVLIIPGTQDYNVFTQETVDESFTQNLTRIIEKLQAAEIPMVLATSHAVNSNPTEPRNEHANQHNEAIRALAQTYQVPLIDFVEITELLHNSVN